MEDGSRRSLRLMGRIALATDETEVECCGFDPSTVLCWVCPCVVCRRCEEDDDPFPVCRNGILNRFHTFPFPSDPDFSSKIAISHHPFSPNHPPTTPTNQLSFPHPFQSIHNSRTSSNKTKKTALFFIDFCWGMYEKLSPLRFFVIGILMGRFRLGYGR